DIIVGYNFITYISAWQISKKLNNPCAARYHEVWIGDWIKNMGVPGIFGEIMERYLLSRNLALILPVSNFTGKKLEKHFPKEKIATVHNIVEFEEVHSEKYKDITISAVSRLVEYKRIGDLIEAMSVLVKKHADLKCKIVGTGAMEDKIKKQVKDLDLEENITFCGFVEDHEDVLKVINSSHIFCITSEVEGFGIVIVEALGCEVPFVSSNIDPLVEASGNKGGLFFKTGEVGDLVDKLDKLLNDHELYNKLKKEGKTQYNKYNRETIGNQLEELYTSVLKNWNK
ncbi:MAG: glycosyltransferase family 4 protein, partial [Methanobrevibacter sp.]|nr:glycosyltransferase family 4 protein [Methanobrevibacter sp.]